jgi:hypothetical protein
MLQIDRLDGGLLIIEAAPIALAFFNAPIVQQFEEVAGTTRRDAITSADLDCLNSSMGARSPRHLWEPVGRPRRWLQQIDPRLDLITTSERGWREIDGSMLVERALTGCLGHGRNIGVATKMLHLKRPRLFPILDRLIVELLGARVPMEAEAEARAREAAKLVVHLRHEGRANLQPLSQIRDRLRTEGVDVSLVRILDAVLWSCHPAAGGIGSRGRVFRCALTR